MAKTKVRTGSLLKNFDGSKECWSCGSKAMKPDERGYVCTKCGTTWTHPPKLAPFPYVDEVVLAGSSLRSAGAVHRRPRKGVA